MNHTLIVCPSWEYENVSGYDTILKARTASAYLVVRQASPEEKIRIARDTRKFHNGYFVGLTPNGFEYYAGGYRGQDPFCLRTYEVRINSDPLVGHAAATVPIEMIDLSERISTAVRDLDFLWEVNSVLVSKEEKLIRVFEVISAIFVYFLEIHPYANGNGHAGRILVVALLARYNVYLTKWSLHPRPSDSNYSVAIAAHRRGNTDDMVRLLMRCV